MAFSVLRVLNRCGTILSNKTVTSNLVKTFQPAIVTYTTITAPKLGKDEVNVTFIKPNGDRVKVKGKVGEHLLDVVVNNGIDLDGFGACDGTLTCSTCHLILAPEFYDKVPDSKTDDESDMLDLALEVTDTSRLGCQVILTKELDGLEVTVPKEINDLRSGDDS